MNEQTQITLEKLLNFFNDGPGTAILTILTLWVIVSGIFGGFFYRWKFVILVGVALLFGMGAGPGSIPILKSALKEVDDQYKELAERIIYYLPIYISLMFFFTIYTIGFIVYTIICLVKFRALKAARKSKIWRRFLYGSGTGLLMVPAVVSLSASFQTNKKQDDGFTKFSIGFMTFFQSKNPSVFVSKLKDFAKLSALQNDKKFEEALKQDYSKLSPEDKEKFQENVVKPLVNILNDPELRKNSLDTLNKVKISEGKTVSQLADSYSPEIKKAEDELQKSNPEYLTATPERKKEILINAVNKELDNQLKNGDLSSQLKLVTDSVGLLKPDAKKDVIDWIGKTVDTKLGKDSGFSEEILTSVLDHLNTSIKNIENK
ncbi:MULTISPECIES: hypothetical protein [unclassified Mycoplasma]|uniref:hypothetical protein n=1 Tax=unclassified Mycoplasma TaxID=2683645 RepID=UPI00211C5731|nr:MULTISPECIES: hypothetical protein [unclassified Mycoplasma]UUM19774.1 hypothetical protein NPA11_03330 [Mycoplasma sp. 1578d]UUM24757.1 hypothetical protein NPA12_03620 [Mycoplasma sp. 3686d]